MSFSGEIMIKIKKSLGLVGANSSDKVTSTFQS